MLYKSELKNRLLRFDGVSEIQPEEVTRFLLLGVHPTNLRVTSETQEVTQFNAQVSVDESIKLVHDELIQVDQGWQLPDSYQRMDFNWYIIESFNELVPKLKYTPEQLELALDRITIELHEIQNRKLGPFFKTLIYVLDKLQENNVIWGVGRGSSCASYLLFILGLHVVDCVLFEVPMEEFFHA